MAKGAGKTGNTLSCTRIEHAVAEAATRRAKHVFVTDQKMLEAFSLRLCHGQLHASRRPLCLGMCVGPLHNVVQQPIPRAPWTPKPKTRAVQIVAIAAQIGLKAGGSGAMGAKMQKDFHNDTRPECGGRTPCVDPPIDRGKCARRRDDVVKVKIFVGSARVAL
ncbi:hypothetical protein GCM10022290_27990 [Sagittula marina]